VGFFQGGSTALLAQLAEPERLVAVDASDEIPRALRSFIDSRGLESTVHCHVGVDQADREMLLSICEREFGGAQVDLVIDDASHELEPSRASFNALFPLLRPGGEYMLEDWSWAHLRAMPVWPEKSPLTLLVFELVMSAAFYPEIVADVEVSKDRALIRRGPGELEPGVFDVATLYGERGRSLLEEIERAAPGGAR
jgi:hypothetical protein